MDNFARQEPLLEGRTEDDISICQVGSIHQIYLRLVSEGYHISEYMLRQMVKRGKIPAIYSGCKALIAYSTVVNLLTRSTG